MIRNLLALVGLLVLMLLGAAEFSPGRSGERLGDPVRLRVSYRDLNLAAPEGVAALEDRVETAVDRICGRGGRGLAGRGSERECRREARESAVGQVHAAIYRAVAADHRVAQPLPPPPATVVFAPPREVVQTRHVEHVRVVKHVRKVKRVQLAAAKAKRRARAPACPQPARRARAAACCCCVQG